MAAERRSLVEGLVATPPALQREREREFVFAGAPASTTPQPTLPPPKPVLQPISTKIREDYAKALKRISLERQIAGTQPNTLQDILEEAIGSWLRADGSLGF